MTCAPKETARPVVFEMLEPRVLLSATPTGEISRDYWTGIAGNYVSTLTNDAAYPDNPTGSDTLSTFESVDWNNPAINKDFADNYSERIRGYLVPVTTGDYTFWISGDNESQLWLSSDQGPANRVLIASTPIYTGQYEWDKAPSQQSAVVALVAGQKYFIEVLHAEGGSNDHLAVGWLKPGEVGTAPSEIIPGSALSVWNAPPVAGDDSFDTLGNTVLTGSVANNDSDAENNPLAYSLTTPATHGTVNLNPDGSFTYSPNVSQLGSIGHGIAAQDPATGTGYLLYSIEDVHNRFAAERPYAPSSRHVIAVVESGGQWFYDYNQGLAAFTPQAGDVLLAAVDFTNDTVTDFAGQTGSVHGIEKGYASGDLTFIANQLQGVPNPGEFTITGTAFTRNTPTNGYAGADSFTYTVDDGQGNTHTATVSLAVHGQTVYEDAADGNTDGWIISDNDPAGATITNVFDEQLNSQVIELSGAGAYNQYRLRNTDGSNWNNTNQFFVEWKMKTSSTFSIYISVDTTAGHRLLVYNNNDYDTLTSGTYVRHGLGNGAMNGQWQIVERDLQADLHEAQPGATILDVNMFIVNGNFRLDDIKLKDSLTGVNQFPTVTTSKLLDTTTFSGASEVSNTAEVQVFGDTFIPIDDYDATYTLVGEARSGDGAGGQYDPANKQYFALASYDVDQYFIDTRYVYRWDSAVDTTLAQALNPGDTQVHLADTTGWHNGSNAYFSNLVWYGYTDSTGYTHPDYTYTRNAKFSTWDENAITGNTITLNAPWTGPTLAAGDAVRNTRASGTHNYIANASSPVPDAWTPYDGSISGETQNGIASYYDFRPGTAYVKPVMLMNRQGATGNLVTYRNVKVFQEDQITVDEGGSTTLIATATDPDGDALTTTWTQTAGPTVTFDDIHSATPTFTAPMVPSDQLLTFQVAVFDGTHTVYDTLELTVKNVPGPNTDPVAVADSATTDEDVAVAIDVMANDFDPNGDLIDIDSFTQPANGSVTRVADNLVYTPTLNHFGSDSFTYTLTDGFGGNDTATVNLTVNPIQDAPLAVDDSAVSQGVGSVAIDVMANDSDPEGDSFDIDSFTQPTHGSVTRVGDDLVYAHTAGYFGLDSFTYTVADSFGNASTATVSIRNDTVYEDAQNGNTEGWYVSDNDPAGATITNVFDPQLNSQVIELNGDGANNQYRFRNADTSNWNNTSQFVFEWKMKTSEYYSIYVSLDTSAGHRWMQYTNSNADNLGNAEYIHHGLGAASSKGHWQIFERDLLADLHEAQPGVTILDVNFIAISGSARFDDIKLKDSVVGIGQLPVVAAGVLRDTTTFGGSNTVTGSAGYSVNFADTLISIDDFDDTYTIVGEARSGDGAGGSYTPINNQYFGFASYDVDSHVIYPYNVKRWNAAVDTTLAQALNPGDTQIHLADATGWYNSTAAHTRAFAWYGYTDSTGHTYPDYTYTRHRAIDAWDQGGITGNTITLRDPWTGPALAAGDAVRNASSGGYSYNALSNQSIPDTWTAYQGGITGEMQNGILSNTQFRTGTAYIKPVALMNWQGDTGNLVTHRNVQVIQTTGITTDEGSLTSLHVNASDADGDALTYTWTQTAGATVTLSDIHATSPTFTAPVAPGDQTLSFRVDVSDGTHTISDTFDVLVENVLGANVNPVAVADSATTDEETSVAIDVMANDSDPNGDLIDIDSFTQPTNGTVTRVADNLVYTPTLNHFGSDSFTYTLTDGFGGTHTATVSVTTANTQQDVPVAVADSVTTDEETPVAIDVMANDSDPDNDTLDIASFTQPTHGSVARVGDNLVYTPMLNYFGGDSFTYVINDGHGGSDTATVNLAIANTQDVPVATADSATTDEEVAVAIDVMANDSDPDNDTLDIDSFTQPAHGSVTRVGDDLVYTPTLNYFGGDSFAYTLTDGQGGSDTATVNLSIANIQDAPVAQGDAFTFFEDQVLHGTVACNDVDADADVLMYSVLGLPQHGTVTMDGQGGFTYAPNINYAGPDSFTYTVADGQGGSDTAAVTLVGTDTPDPTDSDNEPNALGAASDGFLENSESVNTLVFELTDASKKARNAVKTSLVQPFAGAPGVRDVNRDRFVPSQAGRWNVVRSLQRTAQAEGVTQRLETDRAAPSDDSELANEAVQGDHASHQAQATADRLESDAQDNKGTHDPSNEVLQEALQEREEDTLNLLETPVPKEDAVADVDPDRSALGGGLLGGVFLGLVAWRGRRSSRRRVG